MKSSTTNEVLIEDNGQPVLHKSVMTPDNELYLRVNTDRLQFKHQMSDAFVDLSTTLDLPEIVQVTGTFTDKVMSQNAVTNALNTKANANSVVNKTDIVQSTGSSETKVMSQKAVTNMLAQKASQSSLLNLGNSVGTIKNTTIPELRKVVDDNKLEVDRTTADLTEKINTINDTTIPAINKTITDNVSRIDGDIGTLSTAKANVSDVINKTDIVHQPGTANDKVMSQNTTTYNLNLKVDKTAIVQATGNATDKIMSQDAVTKALADVGTNIQVVQTTGSSQTSVMSQKAVTDQVNLKLDKTALSPSTGNGTDVTMSQKAITEFVNSSINSVGTTLTRFEKDIEDNRVNIVDHSTFIDQLIVSNSTLVDDVASLKTNKADKTEIPKNLSQLTADSTHRVVTDTQINTWDNKSNFDGNYNSLSNKPTIPTNASFTLKGLGEKSYNNLTDKPTIPSIKVNNVAQTTLSFTSDPQTQITANHNAIARIEATTNKFKGVYLGQGATLLDITRYNNNANAEFRYYGYQAVDAPHPNAGLYSMQVFYYADNWVGLIYWQLDDTVNGTIYTNTYNGTRKIWGGWVRLSEIVQSYKSSDGSVRWRKWNDGLIEYWANLKEGYGVHNMVGISFSNIGYHVSFGGYMTKYINQTCSTHKVLITDRTASSFRFYDQWGSGLNRCVYLTGY